MKNLILFLTGFLCFSGALAQDEYNIAYPGSQGMYVFTGNLIVNTGFPVDGISAYRIDKKEKNGSWEQVAIIEAPQNKNELVNRFNQAKVPFPAGTIDNYVDLDELWEIIQTERHLDSLILLSGIVPAQIALGNMVLDTDVKHGQDYQYKVYVRRNNRWEPFLLSYPVKYEKPNYKINFRVREKTELENRISVELAVFPRGNILVLQPHRRENFNGNFARVNTRMGYRPRRDTLIVMMEDSLVKENTGYEYTFTAFDFFGNATQVHDTIFAKTFSELTTMVPYNLKGYRLTGAEGNAISWRLRNPGRISNISIYRSESFDGPFEKIGNASPADTIYLDETATPMVQYWYYLDMTDITGKKSFSSAKIFTRYKTSFLPPPPFNISAIPVEGGVGLTWQNSDPNVRGFYLYRSTTDGNFELVSNLLTDSFFVDQSSALVGNQTYRYAIQSENTSYMKSRMSDPAYVIPGIESKPIAPVGMQLVAEPDHLKIFWESVNEGDPSLVGYHILRKEAGTNDWLQLNAIPVKINSFNDSTLQHGLVYEYAVVAIDFRGNKSEIEYSVTHHIPYQGNVLGPPADVKVSTSGQLVEMTWNPLQMEDINGYKVYRRAYGEDYKLVEIIGDPSTGLFSDKGLKKGTLYMYQVTSLDKKGNESGRSKTVAIWF
jgi:fibronectin type 3 domain-containing protein